MKKLLIIFFVVVGITFAQNPDKPTTNPNQTQILQKVLQNTLEALRVKLVDTTELDSLITLATAENVKLDSIISDLASSLLKLINLSANSDSSLTLETLRNGMVEAFKDSSLIKWNAWLASDWATGEKQDTSIARLGTIITHLLTQIARLDTMISDGATSKGYLLAIKDSLNLSISQLLAGLRGASNKTLTDVESAVLGLQTASETLQDVINGIAGTSPNTNTLYDLKQVLDDIQTAAESIKDTDGIKKITDALPAGTNIIGQVGIDQTTDGTTNKVRAFQPTHDNLNANANIQVGDADVANGNPVPVSDAGGSLTVDGTVAVSSTAGNSTFSGDAIAITTAAQLHSNTACKKVTITNYTAGEYVFVGNASVTTANGFPLGYLDSITLTVSNLNLVYVVSDGTSCDIRFSYEN